MQEVRVGCSGWVYKDWRGPFYPERLPQREWLRAYAERFDTVEVNNTFYRLPTRSMAERWVEETPPGFAFAVKGSRYLTHIKRLREMPERLNRFFEPLEPLVEAGKLATTLWQLPGNFERDDDRLDGAIRALASRPGRHAFEFRHPSWFTSAVYERLREADAALVIGDDPERPFAKREITASWTYLRLHRGSRGRRGRYASGELDTWRRRIAAWRARVDVYAYFNNDWEAFAPANATELGAALNALPEDAGTR